ncbi:MAG: hypothetical protein JSR58_01445 [Verrucomicrobia bacterium]|nr:hypothetical protein [Verrucomicrobiota bacterium]
MIKYLPIIPGVIFVWLAWGAFQDLWLYWSLNTPMSAKVEHVEVIERGKSKFELKAYIQNKTCLMGKPYHLNRPSADKAARALEGKTMEFWTNPQKPHLAVLEKKFPLKQIFYSFVALGVMGYFYFLVAYTARRA